MELKPVQILVVEDDEIFASLVRHYLGGALTFPFEFTSTGVLGEAIALISRQRFDVILLDLNLTDCQGLRTFIRLHEVDKATPIIILTSADDENQAVDAIREGAQDYLVKTQANGKVLGRAIQYAMERKRVEETLREREEFFRLISENVQDMIAVIARDGTRLYNSPSYKNLFGDPNSMRGTSSFMDIHPEDRERIKQVFQETVASGVGQRTEFRFLLKDGSIRYIESQGSVIKDAQGQTEKVVVVSRDITERKKAEEELRQTCLKLEQSERSLREAWEDLRASHEQLKATQMNLLQAAKMESVGTLAAGVAHEVKNPLQIIVLGLDYLTMQMKPENPAGERILKEMREAVGRADAIVRGLLDFSSSHQLAVQEQSLNAIIEQALQLVRFQLISQHIEPILELSPDLVMLPLDKIKMEQVFINLFLNAIHAMPSGGTLRVRTALQHRARQASENAALTTASPDLSPWVVAQVEDTGIGIPKEKLDKVFNPFFTTKPHGHGTGLGLSVVKNIVELHGGSISITNRPEGGVNVTFCLKAPINK